MHPAQDIPSSGTLTLWVDMFTDTVSWRVKSSNLR
jgi:hypothetical protein